MGNIVGRPANLGMLDDNGGPTQTHLLLAGPGRHAADPRSTVGTDQRGFGRPGMMTRSRDMGAVESDGTPARTLDFNNDGKYDCADMNLLETNIDNNTNLSTYDVNQDDVVDGGDFSIWNDNKEMSSEGGRGARHSLPVPEGGAVGSPISSHRSAGNRFKLGMERAVPASAQAAAVALPQLTRIASSRVQAEAAALGSSAVFQDSPAISRQGFELASVARATKPTDFRLARAVPQEHAAKDRVFGELWCDVP
jgi:hypothetical protein